MKKHLFVFKKYFCLVLATSLGFSACGGDDSQSDDFSSTEPTSYSQRCNLVEVGKTQISITSPTGRYCVGKNTALLIDLNRNDALGSDPNAKRQLGVTIWYPARLTPNPERATHFRSQVAATLNQVYGFTSPNLNDMVSNAKTNVGLPSNQTFPVIVFSPGLGGNAELYSALLEDMASHGYIVVAIDHPYISGVFVKENGDTVIANFPGDGPALDAFTLAATPVVISDQRFVIDWVIKQNEQEGFLKNHIKVNAISTVGHSYGGHTSVLTAKVDSRVNAGVDIDGTVWGDISGPWTKPIQFIASDDTLLTEKTMRKIYDASTSPIKSWYVLPHSKHNDFTDSKFLLSKLPLDLSELLLGTIDANDAIHQTSEQLRNFLKRVNNT